MITVIVPTMWKAQEINNMLPLLNDHPLIGEIIIIDNDPGLKNEATCSLSKVNYITFNENIFPVASWNQGAKSAKYDKLLIINDDVIFSPTLIDAIYDSINEDTGTIMANGEQVDAAHNASLHKNVKVEDIHLSDVNKLRYRAAVILAIHKNNYRMIPEELKIYYNDCFLFDICERRGKINKIINGAEIRTEMSKTVKFFHDITKLEHRIWPQIYENYLKDNGYV